MNLAAWMTDTIGLGRHVGNSIRGDKEYKLIAEIKARVEYKSEIFTSSLGNESNSTHVIFTENPVEIDDRIWLPNSDFGSVSNSKPVKGVELSSSKDGVNKLYKVFL